MVNLVKVGFLGRLGSIGGFIIAYIINWSRTDVFFNDATVFFNDNTPVV